MGSLLKWLVLSTLAGGVAGLGAVAFLQGLHYGIDQMAQILPGWRLALLPLMGGLSGWVVGRFAPQAAGHGTEAVIAAVHGRDGGGWDGAAAFHRPRELSGGPHKVRVL